MKRTRVLAALIAVTAVAGGLSACSSGSGDESGTIRILEYQKTRADAVEKLIPEFEAAMKKQGKDIKVELVRDIMTDDQFKTKITQQLLAGKAPDVIDMGAGYVTGFAGAGYLTPLDDYLDKWDGWDKYYAPIKKTMKQQDGKVYSLTHEAGVQNLFYRKDVLEGFGIDTSQPKTWDDLIDRLKAVREKTGQASLILPAGTAWGGGTWGEGFLPILVGTDTGFWDAKNGKWDLENQGFADVFDLYGKLLDDKLLPVSDLQNPNPWEPLKYKAFPAGTIPVSAQGSWGWKFDWGPQGQAPIPDVTEKVATWKIPALREGTEPFSELSTGFGYSIPEKSKNKDAAAELATWLSSGKAAAEQLVAVGAAAARDDLTDVAPYADEKQLIAAQNDLASSVYVVTGDGGDKVSQAVATATESMLSGKANASQATASFIKDATDLLGPNLVTTK